MKAIKLVTILCCFVFASCKSTKTVLYDQYSYDQTTAIKAESEKVMNQAITSYTNYQVEIEKLLLNCNTLLTYEKTKPNNEITINMWQLINNEEKNLLGGFLKRWKDKGSLSPFFLEESKKQVIDAFDLLRQYEMTKDKESETSILNLINQ
jgi:hypothetical protein